MNEETIEFSLPNNYHTKRNGLPIDGGTYSFSTSIVSGGQTKNTILFSASYSTP
jgi:hypothetical protein